MSYEYLGTCVSYEYLGTYGSDEYLGTYGSDEHPAGLCEQAANSRVITAA
ncbi:hypothetical protein ACFOZ0_30680 [Streptomyces yaanensis]|uniref:Uncharacterized protein n=1 Tax=Streptomyces yaanensis TaxID=1142239 RepID=A0ABV7SLJ3_9ACTN|nr:hypothetical protein [Streptomyces sp. CGMCC 4.7035]WNC01849.1 hypothetical protein Q2K21_29400 [Streptomyces sp. CGMCC 4.7035]